MGNIPTLIYGLTQIRKIIRKAVDKRLLYTIHQNEDITLQSLMTSDFGAFSDYLKAYYGELFRAVNNLFHIGGRDDLKTNNFLIDIKISYTICYNTYML